MHIEQEMKTVAVLRAFPKDASLGKVLKALSREFRVDCYIWDRQRDYIPIVENENIRYLRCAVRAGFYNLSAFLKMLLFEVWLFNKLLFARLDFIHAIDLGTGFVGWCIAKLRGKTFIYQCLDPYYVIVPEHWPKFLSKAARRIENFIISQADVFIISDMLRMPQHEGAVPKTVIEIANVPMLHHMAPQNSSDSNEFVVGYIGAMIEGRNLLTIVDAIGELANDAVTMVIGGFGPIEQDVKERSMKYRNIRFIGEIPMATENLEVIRIEATFDLFVYVCDPENEGHRWVSPNKLFESMSLGKPIIVAEGTLAARRVEAIGNGLTVRYGSKEELKRAIMLFRNDARITREKGEAGRREFENNWSPELMEKRLRDCYYELFRKKNTD